MNTSTKVTFDVDVSDNPLQGKSYLNKEETIHRLDFEIWKIRRLHANTFFGLKINIMKISTPT